jgi:deazaflavin-dependent oxidoreductase (nitroreductase family)
MYSPKQEGPIQKFIFQVIHLVALGRKLDLTVRNRYTRDQESRFKFFRRVITAGNLWLLKLTGGRLGNSFLGREVLLLTTVGRKTGKPRTLPMYYMQDGDRFFLVASNAGLSEDPVWLKNALASPTVSINLRGRKQSMNCRVASAEEKEKYWPIMTAHFPMWKEVEDRSARKFPVVILEPAMASATKNTPLTHGAPA